MCGLGEDSGDRLCPAAGSRGPEPITVTRAAAAAGTRSTDLGRCERATTWVDSRAVGDGGRGRPGDLGVLRARGDARRTSRSPGSWAPRRSCTSSPRWRCRRSASRSSRRGTASMLADDRPVLLDFYAESAAGRLADRRDLQRRAAGPTRCPPTRWDPTCTTRCTASASGPGSCRSRPAGTATRRRSRCTTSCRPAPRASRSRRARGCRRSRWAPYGEPTITVPATDPPTEAVAQPLLRGDGPQVEAGQVVTVQYVGVTWSDGQGLRLDLGRRQAARRLPDRRGVPAGRLGRGHRRADRRAARCCSCCRRTRASPGPTRTWSNQTVVFVVDILAARGGVEGGSS